MFQSLLHITGNNILVRNLQIIYLFGKYLHFSITTFTKLAKLPRKYTKDMTSVSSMVASALAAYTQPTGILPIELE